MQTAPLSRIVPYVFKNLPSLTRHEAILSNWYSQLCPGQIEWKAWLKEIFSHLLQKPAGLQFELVQSHLVDSGFGEKRLTFGSKQELSIGRDAENEIVLAGKAIAGRHARLVLSDNQLFLEDLGGTIGTYLWDKRINPNRLEPLKNGDQFSVFPYNFRLSLDQSWCPETDIVLGDCSTRMINSAEFIATTPVGWRSFAVNPHPKGNTALVCVSTAFLAELQRRLLGPLRLRVTEIVPSDDTFVGFVMLALLEHLNRRLKFPVQFSFARTKNQYRDDHTRGIMLRSVLAIGGSTGHFQIFLPLDFLPHPEGEVHTARDYPPGLCWTFPVSVGFVDLSPEELKQVEVGDVLVTENAVTALLPNDFSKGWSLLAEASNFRSFRVDKYFERSVDVGAGEAAVSAGKPDISRLPVRLHVVLGEKEFTLAEIESLGPGAILELDAIKPDSIRLMINGKVIGEGELVDVEGKLAVRVLGWRSA